MCKSKTITNCFLSTVSYRALALPLFIIFTQSAMGQVTTHPVTTETQFSTALGGAVNGDTIQAQGTITLPTTFLPHANVANIILDGSGSGIIDGSKHIRNDSLILTAAGGNLIAITGLTFQNIVSNSAGNLSGGVVNVKANLTGGITQSTFNENSVTANGFGAGGAVFVVNDLDGGIESSIFTGNCVTASDYGYGGVFYVGNDIINGITGSKFIGNSVKVTNGDGYGGAVDVENNIYGGITGSTFTNNSVTALQFGSSGAISVWNNLYGGITESNFIGNSVSANNWSSGGAVDVQNNLIGGISNSNFTDNSVTGNDYGYGGAISVWNDFNGRITDSTFTNNSVTINGDGYGGALYVENDLTGGIEASTFTGNSVMADQLGAGGAIVVGTLTGGIIGSSFTNNSVTAKSNGSGGAIYVKNDLTGGIETSSFTGNSVTADQLGAGGALYVENDLTGGIINSTFTNNTVTAKGEGYGGAISVGGFTGAIQNSTFIGNNASTKGGAIFFDVSQGNPINVTLSASEGNVTLFQGNRDGSGANALHFGNNPWGGSSTAVDAMLTVSGAGTVALYDPVSVNMDNGHNFLLTRDTSLGHGAFIWGGANTLTVVGGGTATVSLSQGTTTAAPDFSLVAGANTVLHTTLGAAHILDINPDRLSTLALFDYNNADASSTLLFANGTIVTVASPEQIRSLTPLSVRYLIAQGIITDPSGIVLHNTSEISLDFSQPVKDELWLGMGYTPIIKGGPNVQRGLWALDQWLKDTPAGQNLSDTQYVVFRNNLDSTTPEAVVTSGLSAMNIHSSITDLAMQTAFSMSGTSPTSVSVPLTISAYTPQQSYRPDPAFSRVNFPQAQGVHESESRIWASTFGSFNRVDNSGGYYGYDTDTYGLLGGFTYNVNANMSLGAYVGYTQSDTDYTGLHATSDADGAHLGVLGRYQLGSVFVTSNAAWSHFSNDLARNAATLSTSHSSYSQDVYSVDFGAGYDFSLNENFRLTPFVSTRYLYLNQDGVIETDGLFASRVDSNNADSFTTTLGVGFNHDVTLEKGLVSLGTRVGWKHEFGDTRLSSLASFGAPTLSGAAPLSYLVKSVEGDDNLFLAGAGIAATFTGTGNLTHSIRGDYTGEFSDNRTNHSATLKFDVRF